MKRIAWNLTVMILVLILACMLSASCGCGDDDDDNDDDAGDDDAGDDDDDADQDPPQFDGLVSATGGDQIAILSWNEASDPSTPITYNVYMAEQSGDQDFESPVLSTTELTAEVTDLEICEEYFFVVRARDAAGNQENNTVEKSAVPVNYECGYTQADRLAWSFVPPYGPCHVESVGWIDDVDGDDVPDVLAHAYDSIATPVDGDTTFCLSGAGSGTGQIIWGAHPANDNEPPGQSGGWGDKIIHTAGDLNDDEVPDVLLGTAWGNRSAYALDGTDGGVLWMFSTYTDPQSPDSGWIYQIMPFPDLTADGVPEAIFGAGSFNDSGYLVNGATGEVIWRMGNSSDAIFGVGVLSDVSNDGVPEGVFAAGDDEGRVFCVDGDSSGAGVVLWDSDVGNNFCMAVIDDVNSDGYQDVLAGSWGDNGVVCLNGHTGSELWTSEAVLDPMRIAPLDDVNADGVMDLVVTGLDADAAVVVDGSSGETIWMQSGPATGSIWAVDRVGDINGDGINDVVSGSFDSQVTAFDGTDGAVLWSYDIGDALVKTVRGIPDVTGDCVPDVVAGTQGTSTSVPGSGTVFVLNGCP